MEEFSSFIVQLLDESKCFLQKARNEKSTPVCQAFLHASLLIAISSLEACVNSIAEELLREPYVNRYSLLEQSLLLEREIKFKNGQYSIGSSLKMSRLTDRIEFLYFKFGQKKIQPTDEWYCFLKQAIITRNNLVHPKKNTILTIDQIEQALLSVLNTINSLYLVVYRSKFPAYNLGLHSTIE